MEENRKETNIRKSLAGRYIDSVGQCVFTVDGACDLIIAGKPVQGILIEETPDSVLFNQYSPEKVELYDPSITMEEYDKKNRNTWFTPEQYQEMDIDEFLLNKCENEPQKQRVREELNIYKERNLYPVLRHLVFLVDHFRKNSIVWGVGRGSSVSSYVLFLIGIHKVDSIRYNLSIRDFLK